MNSPHLKPLLALVLPALFVTGARTEEAFVLTDAGRPVAQIVTGENPPEPVAFAAQELRTFVRLLSGAELALSETAAAGMPAIRLGPAAQAKLGPEALVGVERDGYRITVKDGDLCILGLDDRGPHTDIPALLARGVTHDVGAWSFHRGTLYGVYRLLEELGMRWYLPGEFGQRAPRRESLAHAAGEILENPHFITRTVSYWSLGGAGVAFRKDWKGPGIVPGERAAIGFTPVENRLWELRMRGESFRIPLNHNPPRARWRERFAASNPEYFALLPDGTRATNAHPHLCYTDAGMLRENVRDIRAFAAGEDAHARGILTEFPHNRNWSPDIALGDYYSLLPADGFRQCTCPGCQAKVPPDIPLVNQRHSQLVWDFVARAARETPETQLTCLAYGSYSIPYPGMAPLPDNVVVGFTAYTHPASLYYENLFDRYEALLKQWAALSSRPLAYWQHYLAANRGDNVGMPEHTPAMYARVIRTMARHGNHAFCEMMADSILFELFNRYLLLKLFYNPALDEAALFEDFLANFYGPEAAPLLRAVYDDIGRLNVETIRRRAGRIDYWTRFYTAEVLAGYRATLQQARERAAGTPYEPAVAAFDDFYLGLMERGRALFIDSMGDALEVPNPELRALRAASAPAVDGRLDEPDWSRGEAALLYDVDTGKPSDLPTEVRVLHDEQFVYFGIAAHDPGTAALQQVTGEPGTVDGIEIFLDTEHNQQGYYQMTFDLSGRLDERHYPDQIEPARLDWRSQARWKAGFAEDRYVVEIALPREALGVAGADLGARTWGVLVGRTIGARAPGEGRFHSSSRTLRRRFHQPALFNTLSFQK